jgi:hypothetical protein
MLAGVASEHLARGDGRVALVVGEEGLRVRYARDRDAFWLVSGDEYADRPIVTLQVPRSDGLHSLRRDLCDAVARQEVQPPVALGSPFAQRNGDLARVCCCQRTGLEDLLLGTCDLFGCDAGGADLFNRVEHRVAHVVQHLRVAHCRLHRHQPRVVLSASQHEHLRGLLCLDQQLVQATRGRRAEDVGEYLQRGDVLVWPGGDMVRHAHRADIADAPQRHEPLAVLRRLLSVRGVELALRPRDNAERLLNDTESLRRIKVPSNDQHNVIRLVILLVKRPQVCDRYAFNVTAVAEGRFPIVVPLIRRGGDALREHADRRILTALEFVPHHSKLRVQVGLPDGTVHQSVGLQADAERQILVAGRYRLEVVRAVCGRGAVEPCPAVLQGLRNVRVRWRALKQHVLQQVRHACLTIALMSRPDQHGHVHRDGGARLVREQQYAQAVVEAVLGDALNGDDLLRGCPLVGTRGTARADQENYDTETPQQMMFGHDRLRFLPRVLPNSGVIPARALEDLSRGFIQVISPSTLLTSLHHTGMLQLLNIDQSSSVSKGCKEEPHGPQEGDRITA